MGSRVSQLSCTCFSVIYLLPILYSNSAGKAFKGCTNMKATSFLLIIGLSAILSYTMLSVFASPASMDKVESRETHHYNESDMWARSVDYQYNETDEWARNL